MFRDVDYTQLADHGSTSITEFHSELSNEFHRINFASDLHLDFAGIPGSFFIENPGKTLLIAGDIGEVKGWMSDRFQSFFRKASAHWNKVIIIAGNHEHYRNKFSETLKQMRLATAEFMNITILEKDWIEIDGVCFVGGTLWTNFNKADPTAMVAAQFSMNDYRMIRGTTHPITPQVTLDDHLLCIDKFHKILTRKPNMPFVVLSHHAPSMKSVDANYVDDPHLNFAYASDLEQFILSHPNIIHWIHGHMHTRKRYMVGDNTTVHVHARGYPNQFLDYRSYKPAEIFV
jgi:hypothetical protein